MFCCVQSNKSIKKYKKEKAIQIGGSETKEDKEQRLKAIEERIEKNQNRGKSKNAQIELQIKMQKQEELEKYNQKEQYQLRYK